jgi:peptidyl-dipeptidase A
MIIYERGILMEINFNKPTNIKTNDYETKNIQPKTKPFPPDSVTFSSNLKSNEPEFIQLREEISKEMKPLLSNSELACWDFYTESSEENMQKMNSAQEKSNDFFDNPEIYSKLKSINDKGGVQDKKLKKQLRDLSSAFGDGIEFKTELKELDKKENDIAQKLNSYVMTIDDKPVSKAEISKIMQTEKNPEIRKKAFDAKIKSGDLISEDLRDLVKMRNNFAKKKGYDNYYDYKLKENYDITSQALDKLLSDVSEKTKNSNDKVLSKRKKELSQAFGIEPKELKAYHYGYLSDNNPERFVNEQIKTKEEVVDISKNAYKGMGYDVDNLPITLDLFPRDRKNTHGFSFPIEAGKDARILANLTNNVNSIDTLLHELGHSVFTVKTNSKLPYMEQDTTSTMTEAVAMMMGDLPRTEGLLKEKVTPEINEKFQRSLGEEDSSFVSSSMALIDFERNMYKNPDQDLKQLWKDMSVKYKGRSESDDLTNEWATIPHFLSHPAYYQNYFRASLIKAQLYNALTEKFGNITKNKDTAAYLNENLFQYGGSKEDDEILTEITGKPLSADAFCDRINKLVDVE